ncbi:MAG: triple tyrosine motif-containing protein, partial [Bacteroidota bacterium]
RSPLGTADSLVFALTVSAVKARVSPDQPITGNPPVHHFTHIDYNSDSQFWTACQDSNGVMYFGNNYGVLRFDGERWDEAYLPNNSSVRSLFRASDGTIYAGGFNEFGKLVSHPDGSFGYQSLIDKIPSKYQDFGNVWEILEVNGTIVFQSYDYLCILNDNHFEIIEPSTTFGYAGVCNEQLFILDQDQLFTLNVDNSRFTPFITTEQVNHEEILEILPGNEKQSVLIITKEGSLYTVDANTRAIQNTQKLTIPGSNPVFTSAIRSSSGILYTGTLSHHVLSWKLGDGRLKKVRSFPKLQDQTVLGLFEGEEGVIWNLLNKGLDYFDPNAPLTSVFQGSSIYDAVWFNNQLYIATNQGVFQSGQNISKEIFNQKTFTSIPGLEGQAWSLNVVDGQLFCAHDRGLFHLSGNSVKRIGPFDGVWKLYPVSENGDYFVCTYDGLGLISVSSSGIEIQQQTVDGFSESTRDLMAVKDESNTYWVCHGYKGVFRIKTNDAHTRVISTEHFDKEHGLPSPYNINVHRWQGENIFSTNQGLFTFDQDSRSFVIHDELTNLLGDTENVRQLEEQGDTTWCVIDDRIGFFNNSEMEDVVTAPFLSLKGTLNQGMECIVPLERFSATLIGTTNGLFVYRPGITNAKDEKNPPRTHIPLVRFSRNDTTISRRSSTFKHPLNFSNDVYNIHFQFSAPRLRDKTKIQYTYKLEGQMEEWSEWQDKPDVTFSFLKSGDYDLHVKAQSLSGETARATHLGFSIEPAWYATWPWILFWSALGLTLIFSIFKWIQKIILKEKEETRQEEKELQKAREIERENQAITREKERIEAENVEKSKDLANNAMLIAKKRELLIDIQSQLNELRKTAGNDKVRGEMLKIVRNIQMSLNDEKQYQLFDTNLERVHQDLFNELKKRYPS